MPSPFVKGHKRFGGRVAGTPNKATTTVKAALEAAFEGLGGVPSLMAWAASDPTEFYKLWIKMMPADFKVEHTGRSIDEILKAIAERRKLLP